MTSGDTYQYAYNGLGQRVQQTVDSVVTDYLLDTQPALPRILAAITDAATTRYVHSPLGGILSQHDAAGAWHWALVDGVGRVRGMAVGEAARIHSNAQGAVEQCCGAVHRLAPTP